MVKDRHLKSIKTEQVHSDPSWVLFPAYAMCVPLYWANPSWTFCLVNLCNRVFHPQQLGHGVPQFIFISAEGPSSSVRFELVSWEISDPSLCFPWHFSSWFTGSMMSAKNQAQHSPGCLIRLWRLLEYFLIAFRKYFCVYLWVQCLPSFLSTTVLLTSLHLLLPLNHHPPYTHIPFPAGLFLHLVPYPINACSFIRQQKQNYALVLVITLQFFP